MPRSCRAISRDLRSHGLQFITATVATWISDRQIILIDFGAVKQIISQTSHPQLPIQQTVAIGTPAYMPDEQANGNPKLSSDVYTVGTIAIQMLTGISPTQLPRDANTHEILWHNYAQTSDKLAAIIDRMVSRDFRQRYLSATEALEAFDSLNHSLNPSTQLPTTYSISPNISVNRQQRLIPFAVAIVALVAIAIGIVIFAQKIDVQSPANNPENPQKNREAF